MFSFGRSSHLFVWNFKYGYFSWRDSSCWGHGSRGRRSCIPARQTSSPHSLIPNKSWLIHPLARKSCLKGLPHEIEFKYLGKITTYMPKWEPVLVFKFSKCSSDAMSSFPFPMRLRWKHMGDITYIGESFTKFLCSPRRFWLVHWQNAWLFL